MPEQASPCSPAGAVLVRALAALVEYQDDLGIADYRLPAAAAPASPPLAAARVPAGGLAAGGRAAGKKEGPASETLPLDDDLEKIAVDIRACVLGLPEARQCFPGQGPAGAALFLVLGEDAPMTGEGRNPLLTTAEEELLTKMLAAINMPLEQVFLTGVTKCHDSAAPCDSARCLPFLRRQLAQVAPRVVCVMGGLAARLLTGKNLPVSRLRNRLLPVNLLPDRDMRMLVTYHPRFLLQNPDMKRASWDDLRLLKLGLERTG